jgi:hypothetical protein
VAPTAALEVVAVAGVGATVAVRVYFLEISIKPVHVCAKFNEIGGF